MVFKPDKQKVKESLKRVRERNAKIKPTVEGYLHEIEMYYLFEDTRKRVRKYLGYWEGDNENDE